MVGDLLRTRRAVVAVMAAVLVTAGGVAVQGEAAAPGFGGSEVEPDPTISRALAAMYNVDFARANRILDEHLASDPSDPLGHAARAAAVLFAEYDRLKILEFNFFENDDSLTDKARLKPDPAVREKILASTAEVRRLAARRFASDPRDRRASFAMTMGIGTEAQYTAIIEKRYIRGGTLTKETQSLAERMITLDPPIYDAYLTLGSIEYAVSSLNPFYRMLARFRGLRSGKDKAREHLQIVVDKGAYYGPYAKVLLAVLHIREKRLTTARILLEELRTDFPANPLFPREIARLDERISAAGR